MERSCSGSIVILLEKKDSPNKQHSYRSRSNRLSSGEESSSKIVSKVTENKKKHKPTNSVRKIFPKIWKISDPQVCLAVSWVYLPGLAFGRVGIGLGTSYHILELYHMVFGPAQG